MIKSNSFNSKNTTATANALGNSFTGGGSRNCIITPHEFETRLLKTKSTLFKSSSVRNLVRLENGGATAITSSSPSSKTAPYNRSNSHLYSSTNHQHQHHKTNNNNHNHNDRNNNNNFAQNFKIKINNNTNLNCSPPSSSSSGSRPPFRNKPPPPPSPTTASYIYSTQRPLIYTAATRFRTPSQNPPPQNARFTPPASIHTNSDRRNANTSESSSTDEEANKHDESENLIYSRQGSVRGNLNKVKNSVRQVFHDDLSSISSSLSVTNSSQFNYSSTSTCSNSSSSSSNSSENKRGGAPVLNSVQLNSVNNGTPKSSVSAAAVRSVKTYSNLLLVSIRVLCFEFYDK